MVKRFIKDQGLEDKVKLLGRINSYKVKENLKQAAVFSMVSLEENSPICIEEAMAASVPVVTSNRCGMPYMVENSRSGYLVDPHNEQQIGVFLKELLTDIELNRRMGQRGREIAWGRFHPRTVAQKTREVYLKIIDGRLCN